MKRSGVPTFFFRICEEKRKCLYLGCRTGQLHVGCWVGQLGYWVRHEMKRSGVPTFFLEYVKINVNVPI